MGDFLHEMKRQWARMLEPPWQHPELGPASWYAWFMGWSWTLAGLVLGAVVEPSLARSVGLSNIPYRGGLVVAVALLSSILLQLASSAVAMYPGIRLLEGLMQLHIRSCVLVLLWAILCLGLLVSFIALPLAGVGYGIYIYFTWVGADQSSVAIGVVGGLFVEALLVPTTTSVVTGAAFKVLMGWLRRGKKKKKKKKSA